MSEISLRDAGAQDYSALGKLMFDAVRSGESYYSDAQRAAWVPEARGGKAWNERLSGQHIIIAEAENRPVGFMSLEGREDTEAYLDFAYIHPDCQGTGLFKRLYGALETYAAETGYNEISTHASLMACPAFASVGFVLMHSETVEIKDEKLIRFAMEKRLAA